MRRSADAVMLGPWPSCSAALAVLGTDENGLPESDAEEHLAWFGKNFVVSERPPTRYAMLLRGFRKFTVQAKSAPPATGISRRTARRARAAPGYRPVTREAE